MSSYCRPAYHPKSKTIQNALWMDDYFGHYNYGVKFEGDDVVYSPEEVEIPRDKVFVERVDEKTDES